MAKRQISKTNGGQIKGVDPLKSSEREFGEAMRWMVDFMARYLRNNVIEELHKSTVEKFADSEPLVFPLPVYEQRTHKYSHHWYTDTDGVEYDENEYRDAVDGGRWRFLDSLTHHSEPRERKYTVRTGTRWADVTVGGVLRTYGFRDAKQVGNYAAVFLRLNQRAQRKLLKRFDDKRIEKMARQILRKVNRRNAQQFYGRVEDAIGVSAKELMADEGLTYKINALELETAQWAKKLRDETLEVFTANSLRVMAEGGGLEDVLATFSDLEEKRKNHAKMVARTQIANFNSLLGKARAQNIGIQKAVWVTSRDERVRRCHQVRNGKEFDLSKGLYSSCDGKWLLPGTDYNCRCTYRYVIPDDED